MKNKKEDWSNIEKTIEIDNASSFHFFSLTKKRILLLLKKTGGISLQEMADKLEVTKMAVLKQVRVLENEGLVERYHEKPTGKGRPKLMLRLSDLAVNIFPKAYASISVNALKFIEENLGRSAVVTFLRQRKEEIKEEYKQKAEAIKTKPEKIHEKNKPYDLDWISKVAKLRDEEGYMVELKVVQSKIELYEYNCPIFELAEEFPEACQIETEMFRELFDTEVHNDHRVVSGDNVCRFVILN